MRENYSNLCVLNLGKHCYSIMKNNDKVMYFENVNGKYVMPITNFNLYDNQGKSLTLVNQHFFMNQLINRINIALKKGYFSNDTDIVNYLNDLKKNSESDSNLMSLFKGSLMGEINEINFENNKREILKYLDKFRFDTFVNYNNVSIFNGSLEKNDVKEDSTPQVEVLDNNVEVVDSLSNEETVVTEADIVESNTPEVLEEVSESNNLDVLEEVSEPNTEIVEEVNDNSTPNAANNTFDFMNVNSNDSSEFVNSNDYFKSLGSSNSEVQNSSEVVSGISSSDYFSQAGENNIQVQSVQNNLEQNSNGVSEVVTNFDNQVVENVSNNMNNNVQNVSEPVVEQPVVNSVEPVVLQQDNNLFQQNVNNELNSQSIVDNNVSPVQNPEPVVEQPVVNSVEPVSDNQSLGFGGVPQFLENPAFANNVISNDPFSMSNTLDNQQNSNVSYIDEVKDRLNAGNNVSGNLGQSQFNNEMASESLGFSPSNVTVGDSVISDKNELPELEKISSVPIEEGKVDKTDKKSHLGIIIFMILLVIALGALSFYLYNYVF